METKTVETVNISVSITKTKTYEITIDTGLVGYQELFVYENSIDTPSFSFVPDDSELAFDNKKITEPSFLNLAKIIAYMKMKFGTIPVLSSPNGITVVEIQDDKTDEISDYIMDKDVSAVKFKINSYESEHDVYVYD